MTNRIPFDLNTPAPLSVARARITHSHFVRAIRRAVLVVARFGKPGHIGFRLDHAEIEIIRGECTTGMPLPRTDRGGHNEE
jgi:hypothetical protein